MKTVCLFLLLVLPLPLLAQFSAVPGQFAGQRAVGVQVGASPALQVELNGYLPLKSAGGRGPFSLVSSLRTPVFLLKKPDSFRFSLGGAYRLAIRNQWQVTVSGMGLLNRAENVNGRFTGLGTDLTLLPGYYAHRLYGVLWLGWQYQARTHIHHSAYSRNAFADRYPDGSSGLTGPRDGWYPANFSTVRVGAGAGYALKRVTIHVNGGFQTELSPLGIRSHGDLAMLPFFAHAGLTYHW